MLGLFQDGSFFSLFGAEGTPTDPSFLINLGIGGFLALAFWREWIVPGTRYQQVLKERDQAQLELRELYEAVRMDVTPVLTRLADLIPKMLKRRTS